MLRRTSFAAACAVVVLASTTFVSSPATARVEEQGDTTFTIQVFPVDTTAVSFWNSWGARRPGGRRHRGIDIMAPQGASVVAVADGVIEKMGHHRLSGYFIRVDHGAGWVSTYMHLNNDTLGTNDGAGGPWTAYFATLQVGQAVSAGDVIGYVGNSGNAEGKRHHTHFEIKHDGKKENPYQLLVDAFKRERRRPKAQAPF